MKKMFKLLESVHNYNDFYEVDKFEHVNGNQQDIFFRLIQKRATDGPDPSNLRWMPSSLVVVSVQFDSIDSALVINRLATMVFPSDDRSVFKVTVLAGETINGAMKVTLTDGGLTETLLLDGRLVVSGTGSSRFFC